MNEFDNSTKPRINYFIFLENHFSRSLATFISDLTFQPEIHLNKKWNNKGCLIKFDQFLWFFRR